MDIGTNAVGFASERGSSRIVLRKQFGSKVVYVGLSKLSMSISLARVIEKIGVFFQ